MSAHPPDPTLEALAAFEHTLRLTCIDPAENRYRAYALTWRRGLWGELALVRTWGRVDQPGRSRATVYPDRPSAQADIRRCLQRRLRRGYWVVEWR